jgi:hypothetical protein
LEELLNGHSDSDVKQTEIHKIEPILPGPSRLEFAITIAKLKEYKSPGSDQIPAELIQSGGEMLPSAIHKLITSISNKDQWKGDNTDCNNYCEITLLSTSYKILSKILLSR